MDISLYSDRSKYSKYSEYSVLYLLYSLHLLYNNLNSPVLPKVLRGRSNDDVRWGIVFGVVVFDSLFWFSKTKIVFFSSLFLPREARQKNEVILHDLVMFW